MMQSIGVIYFLFSMMLYPVQSQNWTHHNVLDGDGIFHLYWTSPEGQLNDTEICFKVKVKAKGYFGLGFSPNGGMPGSDIVTGWVRDGEIYFQDRHADTFSLPLIDDQQDYELIDAYENDNTTVFEFCRKLATCDRNDMVIGEDTMRVIYAFSDQDPDSDDPFYHGENRGGKSILLLINEIKEDPDLNYTSLSTWDIMSPGIDFSSSVTLYWCRVFKSPQVYEKNHIVYIQPVFEKDHEQYIHHMGIYECIEGTEDEFEVLVTQRGDQCRLPNMPAQLLKCQSFIISWDYGGDAIMFPEHVGLPIYSGAEKYYLFEIHYNNPQLVNRTSDHSGFRLYYTPNLRKYDAGNVMVGSPPLVPRTFIPPGQKEYIVAGHSSSQCVPWTEKGINVIAVSPHAHMLARKFKVRHFRGNQELLPLVDDKNYDFNYKAYRFYMKEHVILPGDQITTECMYNSSERSNATFGGNTARDEMCMCFLLHYPLMQNTPTFSAPSFANINKVLGTNITREHDVIPVLRIYDWANADIVKVQNVLRFSEQETSCSYGYFVEDGVNPLVGYPKGLKPYEPPPICNDTTY